MNFDSTTLLETLNLLFYYDKQEGKLYWKHRVGRAEVGSEAGYVDKSTGYRKVMINKKNFFIHRLIFLIENGKIVDYIDHIDNNKLNNKIVNLRECTHRQNMQNRKPRVDNNSGTTGVSWQDSRKKWLARSSDEKGNRVYLGYYLDYEEAKGVVERFKLEHHKEFARID